MADRSVRVVLGLQAQSYITEARKAAEATRSIGVAAVQARAQINQIGGGAGLVALARQLTALRSAMGGVGSSHDLAAVAAAVRDLNSAGGAGLRAAATDIRALVSAVGRISAAQAADLRNLSGGLRDLNALGSLAGSTASLSSFASGVRRIVGTANSVPALRALAQALRDLGSAGGGLGNLGSAGNSLRGLQSQIDQLRRSVASLRGAGGGGSSGGSSSGGLLGGLLGGGGVARLAGYAAGYLAIGSAIKSTYTQTADFETQLATFGAVSKASGGQLKQAGDLAIKLGGDTTIAGASASDAASALTELAKGGLNVNDSFLAAKGTLQLASAAVVDVGTAAGIQTAALNSFGLGAGEAGKVADILANTAAAASGEVTDFAEGMKQSGSVAHNFGLSLLDNQTILAQFAQAGIKGSMGGNILKSMLLSLEKASGPAGKAMEKMGLNVKNSNGTYITAAQLEQQLTDAKKRLGTTAFNTQAAIAFGTRGIIGAGIAASQGADGFNKMNKEIASGAGAAALSQAKMSGLGGAFLNVKNQIETAQVTLGEKFSPALQSAMNGVSRAIPLFAGFLTGSALGGGASAIGGWFKPIISGAADLIRTAWPYVQSFVSSVGRGFESIVGFIKPAADGIGAFLKGISDNGTVGMFGNVLVGLGKGFEALAGWLRPVGSVIGDVVGFLGQLPKPVYAGAAAMGAFLVLRGPLNAMLLQLVFGYARLGATMMSTFSGGLLAGIRSMGAGLLGVGRSMLSAFGGPVGIAIAGISAAIAIFSGRNRDAAAAVESNNQEIADLQATVDQTTGALTRATAIKIGQNWVTSGADKDFTALGVSAGTASAAIVSGGTSLDAFRAKLVATKPAQDAINQALSESSSSGPGLVAWAKAAGVSIDQVTAAALAGGPAIDVMSKRLAVNGVQAEVVGGALKNFGSSVNDAVPALKDMATAQTNAGLASATQATQAKVAADATAALGGAAKIGAGGVGDMSLANEAAAISALKLGGAASTAADAVQESAGLSLTGLSNISRGLKILQADYINFGSSVAGIHVKLDDKGVFDSFQTDSTVAFAKFKQDASDAGDAADLFWFKMAGPKATAQQAVYAAAAAMRAVAAAGRDQGSNVDAVSSARSGLSSAQTKQTGTDYGSAQKILDVAAARRTLQAAIDAQAGSEANLFSAEVEASKAASGQVEATFKATQVKSGYTVAVAAATAEMGRQRQAFIDNFVAGKQSAMSDAEKVTSLGAVQKAAGQAADGLGLIPSKVQTLIDADPTNLIAKAAAAKKAAEDATQKKTAILDAKIDAAKAKALLLKKLGIEATVDRSGNLILKAGDAINQAHSLSEAAAAATQSRTGTLYLTADAQQASATIAAVNAQIAAARISANSIQGPRGNIGGKQAMFADGGRAGFADGGRPGFALGGPSGRVTAGTGPRADDVSVQVSKGEWIINAASSEKYNGLLGAINSGKFADGGRASMFAAGGVVSGVTALNLSGRSPVALGAAASNVAQALVDIATAVSNARDAASAKKSAAADAGGRLADQKASAKAADQAALDSYNDAAKKRQVASKAADQKVASARSGAARVAAEQARSRLDATQRITSAAAGRSLAKVRATEAAKTKALQGEYDAAKKTAAAYLVSQKAAEGYQRAAQSQFRVQQSNAARMDSLMAKLTVAQDNLSGLQANKASMSSGLSGTVAGFDGGLTGHSDTRTTFANILKGQQYNLGQIQAFSANLTKLKKLGLNNDSLNQLASAGVDGGGAQAAILANSSATSISHLNQVTGQITGYANRVGGTVSGAFYDVGINAAQGIVKGLNSQIGALQKAMNGIAATITSAITKKLQIHSPSKVMHDLGGHVATGFANGIVGGYGGVASATSGMMSIPHIPSGGFGGGGSGGSNVQISFNGSDELSKALSSMIEVRVDGQLQNTGRSLSRAAGQHS